MFRNYAVNVGLLTGLITVATGIGLYLADRSSVYNPFINTGYLAFYLVGMWHVGKRLVLATPDLDFRLILRDMFVVFLLANLMYWLFVYLMLNVIDPKLVTDQRTYFEQMALNTGVVDEENRQKIIGMAEGADQHSWKAITFQMARGAMGGFGLASMLGYLVKRLY